MEMDIIGKIHSFVALGWHSIKLDNKLKKGYNIYIYFLRMFEHIGDEKVHRKIVYLCSSKRNIEHYSSITRWCIWGKFWDLKVLKQEVPTKIFKIIGKIRWKYISLLVFFRLF